LAQAGLQSDWQDALDGVAQGQRANRSGDKLVVNKSPDGCVGRKALRSSTGVEPAAAAGIGRWWRRWWRRRGWWGGRKKKLHRVVLTHHRRRCAGAEAKVVVGVLDVTARIPMKS
jgi:hypothetical protein